MPKFIAIIPVKGREPLLWHTVNRLTKNNIGVVACGHTMSEKVVVEMAGGEFITCKESVTPLGLKWQMCLDKARLHNPDAILFVGSSDWVTPDWCDVLYKDIKKGFAMAGKDDCFMVDIQDQNTIRACHWGGYDKKRSHNNKIKDSDGYEVIGIGRLFGRKFLDMIDWKLFNTNIQSSIDYSQMEKLWQYKVNWKGLMISHNTDQSIKSVSISTYRWPNKHRFENERKYVTAKDIEYPVRWVKKHFPELENLFNY